MKRSASSFSRILSPLIVVIAIAVSALAQTATGSIRGIVSDPSKAIISGAKVTVTNKDTGAARVTQTNSAGEFQFSLLQPGDYEIKVTMQGLSPMSRRSHFKLAKASQAISVWKWAAPMRPSW